MYKSFTAEDYKKHFDLPKDYEVSGFISFGTFKKSPYDQIKEVLNGMNIDVSYRRTITNDFFEPILEFTIDTKTYWFAVAYGGAILSEWLHQACLYGSKINIVVGSCGGLFKEADTPEIIIPTYAYADESSTRMYEPEANGKHKSSEDLDQKLIDKLSQKHKVWHGPTVTCQAMMAETFEDVMQWSSEGYYGVEMEAATVFSVSNHFNRKSAALLVIGDNLVAEKTLLDVNYETNGDIRRAVRADMLQAAIEVLIDK